VKSVLTEARTYKAHDPNGRIPYLEHIKLLWKYTSCPVLANEYIDVHGGYFKGAVTQNIPMIAWPCFRVPISRFCYLPKGKTTGSPALAYYSTNKSQELHNNNLDLQQKTQKNTFF
jgi:hypothetical protein